MSDRIEKTVDLAAPLSRVWRALTDHRQFGEWFRVHIESPFVVGETSRGHITYPGYEHLRWQAVVQKNWPMAEIARMTTAHLLSMACVKM